MEPGNPGFFSFVGLREKEWVGRGFMRVHRSVFERLAEVEDIASYDNCGEPMREFWDRGVYNGRFEHEDMNFCRRARQADFRVMVDTNVQVIHWGHWGYGLRPDFGEPVAVQPEPAVAAA